MVDTRRSRAFSRVPEDKAQNSSKKQKIFSSRKVKYLPVENDCGPETEPSSGQGAFDLQTRRTPDVSVTVAPNSSHLNDHGRTLISTILLQPSSDIPQQSSEILGDLSKFAEKIQNTPTLGAAWRGNFKIREQKIQVIPYNLYEDFKAHNPVEVSLKAYAAARLMPGILDFTLQPRSDVWPKFFRKHRPTEKDVALYFFPGDSRSEVKYGSLMTVIRMNDLSLCTCVGDLELLIFTSDQLPVDSHKLNDSFYLWGAFQKQQRKQSSVYLKENQQKSHVPSVRNINSEDCSQDAYMTRCNNIIPADVLQQRSLLKEVRFMNSNSLNHSYKRGDQSSQGTLSKVHRHEPVENAGVAQAELVGTTEQQDEPDIPPGFERPYTDPLRLPETVTIGVAQERPTGRFPVKMPPVSFNLDVPRVFSDPVELHDRKYISRVIASKEARVIPTTAVFGRSASEKNGCDSERKIPVTEESNGGGSFVSSRENRRNLKINGYNFLEPTLIVWEFQRLLERKKYLLKASGSADDNFQPSTNDIVLIYEVFALPNLTTSREQIIKELSYIAEDQREHAEGIAASICARILKAPIEHKLNYLYLLDFIVKRKPCHVYVPHFESRLREVFCEAYRQVQPDQHSALRRLLEKWSLVFPSLVPKIKDELGFSKTNHHSVSSAS